MNYLQTITIKGACSLKFSRRLNTIAFFLPMTLSSSARMTVFQSSQLSQLVRKARTERNSVKPTEYGDGFEFIRRCIDKPNLVASRDNKRGRSEIGGNVDKFATEASIRSITLSGKLSINATPRKRASACFGGVCYSL